MELINNTTKTLKDDLSVEIKQGSKVSIAAACFSIYAFQELKAQLSQIDELRFIFTSPTFVTEKAKKEKREFYIPRLTRERSLYGIAALAAWTLIPPKTSILRATTSKC